MRDGVVTVRVFHDKGVVRVSVSIGGGSNDRVEYVPRGRTWKMPAALTNVRFKVKNHLQPVGENI